MKLSKETLATLSNFGGISNSMVITEGNRIRIISETNDCVSYADIEETFPQEFGIYDISQFLSALDLVEDGTITFEEDYMEIKNGTSSLLYNYSDVEFIKKAPEKVDFPYEGAVEFSITNALIEAIRKATNNLRLNAVSFTSKAGSSEIYACAIDEKSEDLNSFKVLIGESLATIDNEFNLNISPLLLKTLAKADYEVTISPLGISEWKTAGKQYFLALSDKSKFE